MDEFPIFSMRQELNLRKKEIKPIINASDSSNKSSKKRNRHSYVCTNCKRKKIKCDRQSPCHNCIKSKHASSCVYYSVPENKRSKDGGGGVGASNSVEGVSNIIEDSINGSNDDIPLPSISHSSILNAQMGPPVFADSTSPTYSHSSNSEAFNTPGSTGKLSASWINRQLNGSNGRGDDGFLRNDVEQLKEQIKNLERVLTKASSTESQNFSPGTKSDENQQETVDNSILDFRIKARPNTIMRKQSKTQYFGPLSIVVSMSSNTNILRTMVFVRFLEKERQAWKKIHPKRKLHGLNCSYNRIGEEEHSIIDEIENFFITNYQAVCERLLAFKDKINDSIYSGMFDMNIIFDSFYLEMFRTDDDSGEIKFIRPEKTHNYSTLALIAAIVQCVTLFEREEEVSPYKNILNLPSVEYLDDFAIRILNYSRFQRKLNPFSLMAVLILRDNLFVIGSTYSDLSDDGRSFAFFQIALHIAFQLGIHRDPGIIDKFLFKCNCGHGKLNKLPGTLASNNSKLIWEYLRQLDGYYSIHIGTPLLINDDYCDTGSSSGNNGELHSLLVEYTTLIRELAFSVNSLKLLSLNDFTGLMDKLIEFSFRLGTFDELLSSNNLFEVFPLTANRILVKLKLLRIMHSFSVFLRTLFGKVNLFPLKELTEENIRLLKDNEIYYERLGLKFSYISLCVMGALTDSKSIFKNRNSSMMPFLKYEMSHIVFPVILSLSGYALIGTAFSLFDENTALLSSLKDTQSSASEPSHEFEINSTNDKCGLPDDPILDLYDIDYKEIESSLYHNRTSSVASDESLRKLIRPKQITSNFIQLHSAFSTLSRIDENYGLFCVCKLVVILACFMDSIIKYGETQPDTLANHNNNIDNTDINGKECGELGLIIEEARKKIEANMKLGCVDNGFNLEDNNDTIQNWLNTLFNNDQNLFGIFNGDGSNNGLTGSFANGSEVHLNSTPGGSAFGQPQSILTTEPNALIFGLPAEDKSALTRSLSDING